MKYSEMHTKKGEMHVDLSWSGCSIFYCICAELWNRAELLEGRERREIKDREFLCCWSVAAQGHPGTQNCDFIHILTLIFS